MPRFLDWQSDGCDGCGYTSVNMIYMGLNGSFWCGFYTVTAATQQNPALLVQWRWSDLGVLTALVFSACKKKRIPIFPNLMEKKTQFLLSVEEKRGESSVSVLKTGRFSAMVLRRKGSKLSVTSFQSSLARNVKLTPLLSESSRSDMPVVRSLVYLFCS